MEKISQGMESVGWRREVGVRSAGKTVKGDGLLFFLCLCTPAVWACGQGSRSHADAFVVRDSAGVTLVESREPAWSQEDGWSLGAEPRLRIGQIEGDPAHLFSEIVGVVGMDDGTILVGDFGSQEIRLFDGEGGHLKTVGRKGAGPGEFTGISAMGPGPNGLAWIYDFSLRRLTWLDSRGQVVRLTTLAPEPPMLQPVGPLPDGTFVFRELWAAAAVAEARDAGFRRDPIAYVRFDSAGVLVDTLGVFPGREVFLSQEEGRGVMGTPLFGRTSSGAIWRGGVAVGSQVTFEIELRGPEGGLRRMVRLPDRDLRLPPAEVEAYIDLRVGMAEEGERARVRREMEAMPVPDSHPAYGELRGDLLGNLWVSAFAPFPKIPGSWSVLDPEGRWLGEVSMPEGFYPRDFGPDWVLGTETDEMDVTYVVLYPLSRSTGSGD